MERNTAYLESKLLAAESVIDYELNRSHPPLFALDQYDPSISSHAYPRAQFFRLQQVVRGAGDVGNVLVANAVDYQAQLPGNDLPVLKALRYRCAHTLTDALSRVVGAEAAAKIMIERQPAGEHNLLENIMSVSVKANGSDRLEVDTGTLSYEQFVVATKNGWQAVCRLAADRITER